LTPPRPAKQAASMKPALALLFALPIPVCAACGGADPGPSTPTRAPVTVSITPPAAVPPPEKKQVAEVAAPEPEKPKP
jgi:hypothetical protein